jgi:hypothetical protein
MLVIAQYASEVRIRMTSKNRGKRTTAISSLAQSGSSLILLRPRIRYPDRISVVLATMRASGV